MPDGNNGFAMTIATVAVALIVVGTMLIPAMNNWKDGDTREYTVSVNPFNSFYVAINLYDGANTDDAYQERLSIEKGGVAYILNPENLHRTTEGFRFNPELYNVMLMIPQVYTYSDGEHLYLSNRADYFDGLTLKDYAHTYTKPMFSSEYHSKYLALGVYEAYNLDGTLVSQSGRTPTASQNIDVFRTQALAGNSGNSLGTYQLWNWYQYTLYKEMATAIMGNTDSQYMMGPGKSAESGPNTTGLTDSAYTVSADSSSSVSMLIENAWGSVWELVGDTSFTDYVLKAGNVLGGNSVVNNEVENTLTGTVTIPSGASKSWIEGIYATSEAWGVPLSITTTTPTTGQGINDSMWSNTGNRLLGAGGSWNDGSSDGLSAFRAVGALGGSSAYFGARLAYLTDQSVNVPARDYGYIITYDATNGTVSKVESYQNGEVEDVSSDGTTLNSFWQYGRTESYTISSEPMVNLKPIVVAIPIFFILGILYYLARRVF